MESEKLLHPSTIIPSNLYVERDADRQLNRIISSMGRPGYVLVARQMGKTNLLINMKNKRESLGDVVCYFDLSLRFKTLRGLFRSWIDGILSSHISLASLSAEIEEERRARPVEANVEYERHLRLALRTLNGTRLIIVLDEIDSLVSVPYSDLVFSQIRSMYFSRINFAEYNHLTYVLSGVAEPTELIKDKNISPFNIGQKIFLEDFSVAEFDSFIARSKLDLSREVREAVYSWTSGNPRMTWDVCSEIEDLLLAREVVTTETVKAVVEKFYLTAFDRPPVDHIRSLAEADPLVREAIITIRYGKGETLTEKARSRLYLAGITSSMDSGVAALKNKIIDAALSDVWLRQAASGTADPLEVPSQAFASANYAAAVRLYDEYTAHHGEASPLSGLHRLRYGVSLFEVGDAYRAVEALRAALSEELPPGDRERGLYALGASLLRTDALEDSVELLQQAAEATDPSVRRAAKLALGTAYLAADPRANYAATIAVAESLLADFSETAEGALGRAEMVASAHYNLALAHHYNRQRFRARASLKSALDEAPQRLVPAILLFEINLDEDRRFRTQRAERVADYIIQNELELPSAPGASLAFNEHVLATTLVRLLGSGSEESYEKLLTYAEHRLYGSRISRFSIILRLANSAQGSSDRGLFSTLLWRSVGSQDQFTSNKALFESLRLLALHTPDRKAEANRIYLDTFKKRMKPEDLTRDDILVLFNSYTFAIRHRDADMAVEILGAVKMFESTILEDQPVFYVVFAAQEMEFYSERRDPLNARRIATELLGNVERLDLHKKIGKEFEGLVGNIVASAQNYLFRPSSDLRAKFGRNERVRVRDTETGRESVSKFKFVEAGVKSGRLELLPLPLPTDVRTTRD